MSGVEVAGLVLGALPLVIAAIESYNEGLDPIKSMMRWERQLPQLIRKLRNEHVHFAQTMRQLLEPITDEFELDEMLSEPSGRLWKDHDMAEKLRDKLQESFMAYQATINEIETIMKEIARKLDVDRDKKMNHNDLEAIVAANPQKNNKFEFGKRVRFGMSKKGIKAKLDELHECNKELERFTDKSEKLESYRKVTKPSFANRIQRIQGLAKNLHSSILSSWSCACRSNHETRLQLDQRGSLYAKAATKQSTLTKTCFVVSFTTIGDDVHSWRRQEAQIDIEEEEQLPKRVESIQLRPKIGKTVSFGAKAPPPYSANADSTTATAGQALKEVEDLCASIHQLYKSSPCIGFSLNSKSRLRGVYPVQRTFPDRDEALRELITLDELLAHPPTVNGRPMKLTRKERYSLAVTLASSALQLNATPWFPDQWSGKDIVFHRMSSRGPQIVDIDHPYIASHLAAGAVHATNGNAHLHAIAKPSQGGGGTAFNKNTVLLALAIALLELYFGVPSTSRNHGPSSTPNTNSNPWALCAMAYEWAETEQGDMSAAFSSAVAHCLRCFSDPGASLQDVEFLQAAVEKIVLPLQDELYQFLGKPGP
ncbi:hypothetical protein BU24DRAFT_411993 [Aaosphaeria arxii CBS 175.79]|uniref:DUF7580 domain-containing protein n=1 Tax=Aaosphaeria arxii CBS 175.79 TaxID=1450172 RepID=A0A6A5XHB8_9PLEO|nr:uncharacterized protein BU24DRAFT_411993 [Aaosphaeria arxii CBS 175.79]KAF2012655.1 hypothetical protein BU24DRAFT_411993 [Aaosphaeria arxii CBS 175.79]